MRHLRSLLLLSFFLSIASAGLAQRPPCLPCVGVTVESPEEAAKALGEVPALEEEARLYVRWRHDLDRPWIPAPAERIEAAGGTPWVELVFRTPSPLVENAETLERELAAAAEIADRAGPLTHFQLRWTGFSRDTIAEYAFLFKRASVAISGALPDARVLPQALPAEAEPIQAFYAEETAAYLTGIAVEPAGSGLQEIVALLGELDPGMPLVVDGATFPAVPELAVAEAARHAAGGAALTFFGAVEPAAGTLAPLAVTAREVQGDLSFDPYSTPSGADAWAFVRGEDLGLRVIVAPSSEPVTLLFSDPQLRSPSRIDLVTGEESPLFDLDRGPEGLSVRLENLDRGALLRLERMTAAELEGVEEELLVQEERQMPVEEILRRLQAFEDEQSRRLSHYRATNTTHLRFAGGGDQTFEVTFRGPFYFRQGEGFDWAWDALFINGVRWRGERLPEIPLIQPEKAAALPLEIQLTRDYRYSLRGTATVEGRDAWVVDFAPRETVDAEGRRLFRGTVWVDREHYGRLRTRAIQLGLQGEVISSEETVTFRPVDASGEPTTYRPDAFWLPVHTEGQQLLSIVNSALTVEREILLTGLTLNGPDFEERLRETLASDVTMVRDTERGLRYLVKEEDGEGRVVKEGFDRDKIFLLGGVFYDDALDYPLPLAGVNYLSLGYRESRNQVNFFFAGALATLDVANPRLFGSKFDAGFEAFGLAVPLSDSVYRDDEEIVSEEVESQRASVELNLGRPIGNFFRLGLQYDATWLGFSGADDTAEDFTIPSDHVLSSLSLSGRYSRGGYKLGFSAAWNHRSSWDPWGTPDQVASFDPDTDQFTTWELTAAKSWYLGGFQTLGMEANWVGGDRLDRFSKYGFGFFGSTRVHGYQSGRVRAEEAILGHLTYGFEVGEIFRLEGIGDVAWATDEAAGLRDELLAGVGVAGSFLGPKQTLVRLDLGLPVAGPDDGFVAYLVFLKLFR